MLKQQLDFSTDWCALNCPFFFDVLPWLMYQRMLHNASRGFHANQITKTFLDGTLSICRYSRFNSLCCADLSTVFISNLQLFVYLLSLVMLAYSVDCESWKEIVWDMHAHSHVHEIPQCTGIQVPVGSMSMSFYLFCSSGLALIVAFDTVQTWHPLKRPMTFKAANLHPGWSGDIPKHIILTWENPKSCVFLIQGQELQMVREALETNQGRLSLRWALEPMTGTYLGWWKHHGNLEVRWKRHNWNGHSEVQKIQPWWRLHAVMSRLSFIDPTFAQKTTLQSSKDVCVVIHTERWVPYRQQTRFWFELGFWWTISGACCKLLGDFCNMTHDGFKACPCHLWDWRLVG